MSKYSYKELRNLMPLMAGDEKHPFSAASTLDVNRMLHDSVLRISSDNLEKQNALVFTAQRPRQRRFTGCRLPRDPADTQRRLIHANMHAK